MALKKDEGILLKLAAKPRAGLTSVMRQSQRGGRWCWAACTSMVLRGTLRQCAIAGQVLKGDCEQTQTTAPCTNVEKARPNCDVGYPVDDIEALWRQVGVSTVSAQTAIGWTAVLDELRAGNPVEVFFGTSAQAGESGHLVLLIDAEVDATGIQKVLIADPASDNHGVSPKDFDALRKDMNWGEWTRTWTGLRF